MSDSLKRKNAPGAGRPPLAGERATPKTIALTRAEWDSLREVNPKSYALAVRALIARHLENNRS